MLILTRRTGETLRIGDDVEVTVMAVNGLQVRIGIKAPRNVAVDLTRRELHLSEILSFYTEDFLAKAPSLPAYVNRWRTDTVPEDYRVTFFPYDWTINRQGRASS